MCGRCRRLGAAPAGMCGEGVREPRSAVPLLGLDLAAIVPNFGQDRGLVGSLASGRRARCEGSHGPGGLWS